MHLLNHGMALTVQNGELVSYLVYTLGAAFLALIAAFKWMAKTVTPLFREFFDEHKTTMQTARVVMEKMGDTAATIQTDVSDVKQTLKTHGEKLDTIDRRTEHLGQI